MKRAALLKRAVIAILCVAAFAWGWAAGSRHVFPHAQVQAVKAMLAPAPAEPLPMYTNPNAVRAGKMDAWLQTRADIVMVGDSITAPGRWDEMFPGASIANRGISGDTVTGLLERAPAIAAMRPRAIFVLIGINDIAGGNDNARIIDRYGRALEILASTGARIVIQSTLQCSSADCTPAIRAQVDTLNTALKRIAAGHGWRFVDLNTRFSDANGLKPAYTYDGVHLNGAGYQLWRGMIGGEIAAFQSSPSGREQPLDR